MREGMRITSCIRAKLQYNLKANHNCAVVAATEPFVV